jgi:hypothetical protein
MKPTPPDQPIRDKASPVNQGSLLGKPVVKAVITPDMRDRIIVVRRDIRKGGYKVPKQGKPFKGTDEFKTSEGYVFATVQYPEPNGVYVDEYYVKSRADQERYNWTVAYPYVDKHYPQLTRTYVCFRSDYMVLKEPDADTTDPTASDLFLVDHKIERIENDPVLDAMFVKVVRVFERLPSPTIRSYDMNQFQQVVSTDVWEVVSGPPPALAATIEKSMQERTGTAKAKNTSSAVPSVFPQKGQKREIPSMTRELWLGGFEEVSDSTVSAGQVTTPVLSPGVYSVTGDQITEFKKKDTILSLPQPQDRHHKEVTSEFGGGILSEDMFIDSPSSSLDIDSGYLFTEAKLRNLGNFGKVKMSKKLSGATRWPILQEEKVLTDGPEAGIKIIITKQYVPAGTKADGSGPPYTTNPGGFTDLTPHDKWRTIQITSRVDLTTLPKPVTYAASHPLDIPPSLLSLIGVCGDKGGKSQTVTRDGQSGEGVSVSVDTGPVGTFMHTSQDGFRGMALAEITRIFSSTPPTVTANNSVVINGKTYTPFKFLPVMGTASLVSLYSRFSASQNGDPGGTARGSSSSNQGQVRVQMLELRPMLTGTFVKSVGPKMMDARTGATIAGTVYTGAANSAGARTTDGNYHVELFQPGNTVTMRVNIPLSTPQVTPASGTRLLMEVDVKEWRFGIWVIHLVTAIVP